MAAIEEFPRSKERGLIEVPAICGLLTSGHSGFRVRKSAASLKSHARLHVSRVLSVSAFERARPH